MEIIAHIHNVYTGKFGIPRQSGLADTVESRIVFEKAYAREEAFRGLEGFSHLWILWEFSENTERGWSLTVRPPKLGGNARVGVFATRSPFRPNPIGLSCVQLKSILHTENGVELVVTGADLMDETPVYDIKPYVPYTDAHPEALSGFVPEPDSIELKVERYESYPASMSEGAIHTLEAILAQDPRPAYQQDPERIYGMSYDHWNVKFRVSDRTVYIVDIEKEED